MCSDGRKRWGRYEKNSLCTAHTAHRVGATHRASCHADNRPGTIRPWLSVVPKGHRPLSSTDAAVRDRPAGQSLMASPHEFMSDRGPFVTEPSREFRRTPCPGNPAVRRRRTPRRARGRLRPPGARAARRALTGRTPRGRQHPAPVFHTPPTRTPTPGCHRTELLERSGQDGHPPRRTRALPTTEPEPGSTRAGATAPGAECFSPVLSAGHGAGARSDP